MSLYYQVLVNDSIAFPIEEFFPELRKLSLASSVRFAFFNESTRKGSVSGGQKLEKGFFKTFFGSFYAERNTNREANFEKLKSKIEHNKKLRVKTIQVEEYALVENMKTKEIISKTRLRGIEMIY